MAEGSTPRAVIWDLGGVLVRTEDWAPRTNLARSFGLSREQLEETVFGGDRGVRAARGEITEEELWSQVGAVLNVPPPEMARLQRDFWAGDKLDTALIEFIRALRPRYRTELLSNAWSGLRKALTNQLRITDAFDDLIISAEVGVIKPDPRIYQLAVERLGVAPENAIFVDDMPDNVAGARAVGLHAVQFRDSAQARREVQQWLAADGKE